MLEQEFVACRVDAARPGVLLLSPFTGAADTMPEALIGTNQSLSGWNPVLLKDLKSTLSCKHEESKSLVSSLDTCLGDFTPLLGPNSD